MSAPPPQVTYTTVSRAPGLQFAPYVWRDPARLTPERLEELAARDARLLVLAEPDEAPARKRAQSATARKHRRAGL